MKIIKYNLCTKVNDGTEEILSAVTLVWNEVNEETAKAEAHNGEYEIIDDGQSEAIVEATLEDRVGNLEVDSSEMKEALNMILQGVTE